MKSLLLFLALLASTAPAAHAQTSLKIGLKGGVNLAGYTGPDNADSKAKYGFSAGASFNFPLSEIISLQPELLYSQKGMKLDYAANNSDVTLFMSGTTAGTFGQTLSYIDVPVLLRLNTGGADGSGLFFELGPQGSFLVAQRGFVDSGGKATVVKVGSERDNPIAGPFSSSAPHVAVGNSTNDFNKVMIGYVAGFGYQLTNGLSVGLRYTGDISQVYKQADATADAFKPYQVLGSKFFNPNLRNSVFQFQAGYAFGGK